ncbi:MAG: hypothetical protein JNL08_09205 [Planctomycetes bacterium]|nr:hypothetical protein [Planctomycetota bacterium]
MSEPDLQALVHAHAAETDHGSAAAAARRGAVRALHDGGRLAAVADRCAAARILLPGPVADVELAQALVLAAMAHEPAARRLAAEAYDRLRVLAGRPQKFGTQTTVHDGRGELWPVDAATTDSERAKWGVEPLAELRRRAATMRG